VRFETIGQKLAAAAQYNMRNVIKEIDALAPLNIPVPPMLAKAIGYKGEARFVSLQWTPYGDEADYSDGRLSGTGNWQAFLAYIQHPAVSPFLKEYALVLLCQILSEHSSLNCSVVIHHTTA
jgi:hypothetical protein